MTSPSPLSPEEQKAQDEATAEFMSQQDDVMEEATKLFIDHFGSDEHFYDLLLCQCKDEQYFIEYMLQEFADDIPNLKDNYIILGQIAFCSDIGLVR